MNNIEQNALRIAELLGYKKVLDMYCQNGQSFHEHKIETFSSYNGLMDIVFESKKFGTYSINILAVSVVFGGYRFFNEFEAIHGKSFDTESKESFIEAIQECVIKYLEVKNA